jgi:hypothetical protein
MSAENGAAPTAAVAKRPDRTPLSRRNPVELAEHFWKSGYFSDVKSMSQAVVKVVFGEELGLGVGASMRGIHIIEESPSFSANILATLIKRSEHYDYKVRESTEEKCSIEFFEDGESLGLVSFTIEQARKIKTRQKGQWVQLADTLRWQNSPQDMLFARCLTRGERQHCPDVTGGHPAYTPEELTNEVDDRGDPVFVESQVEPTEAAPDDRPRLHDDVLDQLVKGYEIAAPELGALSKLDGLNVLLGSLGFDGIDSEPDLDIREVMAYWSPAQAEEVNAEFTKLIDEAAEPAEEVEGEIVDEAPTGGEAANANA